MTEARVVLVTVPSREEGERIAEAVVGEGLAACVNIVGPIRSVYRWQGEVCRDDEHLLLMKTCRDRYGALETRVLELHPYDVPEVIALPVEEGAVPYLSWIDAQTRTG
jgi:periplasmic divalent cation tolerance protein